MPLIQVSNLLVTVNSSVNFFVYCTFGQKFRTVFMQMFCGQKVHIISIFWPLQYMQKYSINFFFDRNENGSGFHIDIFWNDIGHVVIPYVEPICKCTLEGMQSKSISSSNGQIMFLCSLEYKQ